MLARSGNKVGSGSGQKVVQSGTITKHALGIFTFTS